MTRRQFLKYCQLSTAALGLDAAGFGLVQKALADSRGPAVVWLLGSACTGCSISLLNRISERVGEPASVVELCAETIDLVFHPTLMASAGESAAALLRQTLAQGDFILVVEGAVPLAFGGRACLVYSYGGIEVTMEQLVQQCAARARHTVAVGTCAAFGGIPAAGRNPTTALGIRELTGRPTINISGCPANPDWVIWAIVQLLLGRTVALDADSRPSALYTLSHSGHTEPSNPHDKCPRNPVSRGVSRAQQLGENGHCLENLGCRGPFTKARCEASWNGIGGAVAPQPHPGHWCIGVNAPCHGCVEKSFPGT